MPPLSESHQLKSEADMRRAVLGRSGCSTYLLRPTTVLCLCCGMESHNREDMSKLFCGFCNQFHHKEPMRSLAKKEPLKTFDGIQTGDIIRHVEDPTGRAFIVSDNYGNRLTASRTVDVTNPREWSLVIKANYDMESLK